MTASSVALLAPDELTGSQIAVWREIIDADETFASPYFSPYFTNAVAQARNDVQVAIWRKGGEYVGFLPFHRRPMNVGKPIAGPLNDYQAIIGRPSFRPDVGQIMHDCRLDAFDFQNLRAEQLPPVSGGATPFPGTLHVCETGEARFLDLSNGFEAYYRQRQQQGVSELKKTMKKKRKLEREVGPVRLVAHSDDPKVLQALHEWKGLQYARTGEFNAFSLQWISQVLQAVLAQNGPKFSGALSALYAGDELAAVHLGMHTDKAWHYWFPTHNPALSRYSPGMILALETAAYAADIGVSRIDLGKGDTRFKTSLGSDAIALKAGYMGRPGLASSIRKARFLTEDNAEKLPIGDARSWPARLFKRMERRLDRRA